MASRMDDFRKFITKYPGIKEDVINGNHTWQQMYEDWVILGENDSIWNKYQKRTPSDVSDSKNKQTLEDLLSTTSLKNIMNYIKKIDPDSISKTLNTIQKVLQITQSFNNKPTGIYNNNYNSWWD